jgi:lysophospholipase L1-like esterase
VEDGHGANAFDGNPSTDWETQYFGALPYPPHELQINLGGVYNVCGFYYLGRQVTTHGHIGQYQFFVSMDGVNWGTPVATGSFPNTALEQEVFFTPKMGQYVRFLELTEVDYQAYAAVAELNVLQTGSSSNQLPTGSIVSPATDATIVAGTTINFQAAANDPYSILPLNYRWSFQPGSGIDDITVQNPGLVRFNIPGVYTVTFTAANSFHAAVTDTRTITVLGGSTLIPKTNWSLRFFDSAQSGFPATNAFDGNTSTYWLTESLVSPPQPPHEIQIDLGATYDIAGLHYLPRPDSSTGRVGQYRIYVSTDGVTWGIPVAWSTFVDSPNEQEVLFASKQGRYVRFQATSEVNGMAPTAVAEISLLQPPIVAPSVHLTSPTSRYLQLSNNLAVLATGNLSAGQGIRFLIDGGSPMDVYSSPFTATFPGINTSPHTIDAFGIDGGGGLVNGVAAHDQATGVGIGEYYVTVGDSITYGYADDVYSDDISQDGRTTGGGYEPVLANLLENAVGHPVLIYNEGIGGDTALDGAAVIQRILQRHPNGQRFLIMYGANDSEPSGLGLHPGDSGYAGSFKESMQHMINDLNSAGKTPILAKAPPTPYDSVRNSRIQGYNSVVAELVSDPNNHITVTPPDFFTYYSNHTEQLADGVHPNGVGYQSMANLWFQSLNQ